MNNYKEHFKKMKSNSFPVRAKTEKRKIIKNNNTNFPVKFVFLMSFIMCIAIYGFLYPENLIQISQKISIFSMSEAKEAEHSAQAASPKEEQIAEKVAEKKPTKKMDESTEVSDNANYVQYLEERKKGLDEKEKQLKELEEKLQQEKVALEKKVEELEVKRREIASKLESRVQQDEESVKKLVDMYSNMKPQSAAAVMASLDDELAINILKRMKKQEAGNILNFMSPQKAKALSEKYTGY